MTPSTPRVETTLHGRVAHALAILAAALLSAWPALLNRYPLLYADFSGNLDSCIAIRTLFMDGDKGYIQAGAGIVADSIPQKELEECGNKAKAVARAIERARVA